MRTVSSLLGTRWPALPREKQTAIALGVCWIIVYVALLVAILISSASQA